MSKKMEDLLNGIGKNYIFPFLWLRGEDESVLREYIRVIHEANIGAVCVESRPHPDFCGDRWWHDMDVILGEAKKRNMKIWILDDSHFPTGFANGAVADAPDALCRQSICCRINPVHTGEKVVITEGLLEHPDPFVPTHVEQYVGEKNPRKFDDDRLLAIYAVSAGGTFTDLAEKIRDGAMRWEVPEGDWKIYTLHLTRNMGYHRSYINMLSAPSCKILLDAVYEPNYEHYKKYFGTTIAGFFSDEPELGNGHIYEKDMQMGRDVDYPWSQELEDKLRNSLGKDYRNSLYLLWENKADEQEKARVRYAYMDAVSSLVKQDFSMQIGNWCRERGVQYIGHLIEDNNQHARTGSSLGHYFRGLAGQDMAGIDDIGGQVFPQGEDVNINEPYRKRIGEFYHYMLGKLASSAAAVEPLKNGNSMCEIFGAYGWSEGVQMEKCLVDHFMVRGINHFVPHAFSAAEYPDPDCPPHFYAHGNNPQYRHFGKLMAYTNRICELISDGYGVIPAAILYHGEGEWTGKYMESHVPAHLLYDAQIDYVFVPQDVFSEKETYDTRIEDKSLKINGQKYAVMLIPAHQFITAALAEAIGRMCDQGIKVYFLEEYPEGLCNDQEKTSILMKEIKKAKLIRLEELVSVVREQSAVDISIIPANDRIRFYHYEHKDGTGIYMLVNEGASAYQGKMRVSDTRYRYLYCAWDNTAFAMEQGTDEISVELMPRESALLVLDDKAETIKDRMQKIPTYRREKEIEWNGEWERSICRSIEYPSFREKQKVILPDKLQEEKPEFSGYVRYENSFEAEKGKTYFLTVTDAAEGVELFVNGISKGIQIVPEYRYELTKEIVDGTNRIAIEVATTLERENANNQNPYGTKVEPTSRSGITGEVTLFAVK